MFQQDYSAQHLRYFGIPRSILPKVVASNNSTTFGYIDPTIFESPDLETVNNFKLPITAILADQGASAFGLDCVNKGDMKATLGTGAFFDINTGESPHCTFDGLVGSYLRLYSNTNSYIVHKSLINCIFQYVNIFF